LYVFGHDLIVRQLQVIHTGLASGQGMALVQPFTPYVEAVLIMGASLHNRAMWLTALVYHCQAIRFGSCWMSLTLLYL